MDHPKGHTSEITHDHTGGGHDEGEHHGEKQSVMKRIKAKAKNIKDSIKGNVGHGHDHDHDGELEVDDDEMDTDPDNHGAPATHGTNVGKEGLPRQHIGANIGEKTATEGHVPAGGPGAYQSFNPKETHSVPGQEETLGSSRTDTGPVLGSKNEPYVPGSAHSSGTDIGEKTTIGGHSPAGSPGAYQAFNPKTTHSVPGQEETLGGSRTDTGPVLGSENQGHVRRHTHTPGISHSSGNHSSGDLEVVHKPKLGGILGKDSHVLKHVGEDVLPGSHNTKVGGATTGGDGSTVAQDTGLGQGKGTSRQNEGYIGKGDTVEKASHAPVSKPVEYQTFDTNSSIDIPGQEETLGRSRTDTGRSNLSEEQPYAPKSSPIVAHPGHHQTEVLGTGETRESGKLGEAFNRPTNLEKDLHAPREAGERRHAENYQTKVTDPTGGGGEEIGVTPIQHQLGRMNIHDESIQKSDSTVKTGQQEQLFKPSLGQHQKISEGSHDQFSPEEVPEAQYDADIPISRGLHDEEQVPEARYEADIPISRGLHDKEEHKPESYTEKISSVASELATKAKLATGSVTPKLGYGGTHDTQANVGSTVPPLNEQPMQGPLKDKPVPGGYGETLSSITSSITNTAVNAKDAVASKVGYGGTHEGQLEHGADYGDDQSKSGGSVGDDQSKSGLGPAVGSKVQGSGPEYDVEPTGGAPDKGVSAKKYLAEKLTPGEEDKALSKVITEALPLHKPKEDSTENPINVGHGDEVQNNEIEHQVTESDKEKKVVIKGRVTESEEVANRLGRAEDTSYDGAGPGLASPGKSVMDRIKDAAGSWFNVSGEPQVNPDDHTEGNEKTDTNTVGKTQQKQTIGETGLK